MPISCVIVTVLRIQMLHKNNNFSKKASDAYGYHP